MCSGMPTHFHRDFGAPVAIETHVHLLSDHYKAAQQGRLTLIEMDEGVIDDAWIAKKPSGAAFEGSRSALYSFGGRATTDRSY